MAERFAGDSMSTNDTPLDLVEAALRHEETQRVPYNSMLSPPATQKLLPSGTPAQIRAEVYRLASEMGRGGGYILEPGITLQADVPLANLVAVVEAAESVRRS
jgi:hypothetical protein